MTPDTPENTGQTCDRDARGRWCKGTSGNPDGRPLGSRHRATLAAEALVQERAAELVNAAISSALGGNATLLRALLDRILPRREAVIALDLPHVQTAADAVAGLSALLAAVANGELSASEAAGLGSLLKDWADAREAAQLEARMLDLSKCAQLVPRMGLGTREMEQAGCSPGGAPSVAKATQLCLERRLEERR